jgi:hypothetical protein
LTPYPENSTRHCERIGNIWLRRNSSTTRFVFLNVGVASAGIADVKASVKLYIRLDGEPFVGVGKPSVVPGKKKEGVSCRGNVVYSVF